MSSSSQLHHTLFRILLYRNDASEILVEATPQGFRLPILSVPAHSREAEGITAAIRISWNLETYGLFRLSAGVSPHPFVHDYIVETCQPDKPPPDRMEWLSDGSLSGKAFQSPSDVAAIENSLRVLDQYRRDELPGSFGKPGWLRVVTEWVEAQSAAAGLHLTGAVRQFNASPTFSLIRFATDGPALWFKAVGEPNLREFPITCALAHLLPAYVLPLVATRADWNAWLTSEIQGTHPDADAGLDTWVTVARTLAALQVASHGTTLHLLNAGCHDTRISNLAEMVDPFLEVVAGLMEQQNTSCPSRLSAKELLALGSHLRKIFRHLAHSSIPSALSHLDLNPGNILLSGSQCVFLDWAEACVGQPFVAFEYLLEHLRKLRPGHPWEAQLAGAYAQRWRSLIDTDTIAEAMAAAPLLAVFTCAVAGGTWRDTYRRSRPEIAALLRSLTRRMKREVTGLEARRVPCLS
jgi:hypothetical protein